jgi:hypothetical protein
MYSRSVPMPENVAKQKSVAEASRGFLAGSMSCSSTPALVSSGRLISETGVESTAHSQSALSARSSDRGAAAAFADPTSTVLNTSINAPIGTPN